MMVEKNYDPDNDNCPEKDMVENLHNSKQNNAQTAEEFIDSNPNRISKEKAKDLEQNSKINQTKD